MSVLIYSTASPFLRGVVYDVGLNFGGTSLSVKSFDSRQVEYDMSIISHVLNCNAVRVEGEDLNRLMTASRLAHTAGLKVFFNPWLMEADPARTIEYMSEAAKVAEQLRREGVDKTFVAGCEYTLFSKGVFPGDTFDERFKWLMTLGDGSRTKEEAYAEITSRNTKLNNILSEICAAVRSNFNGAVTYSSGTWETVDWSMFDMAGLDHYRHNESDEEYLSVITNNKSSGKPVIVLETGCCTYKGAAARGGEGFAILQGVNSDGNGIYEGGTPPERSETEQADYVETQISLLADVADGVFIYVFSYPIYPYSEQGVDLDMTSYALVKSFPATDSRSTMIPAWKPKEAFFRLGDIYTRMSNVK